MLRLILISLLFALSGNLFAQSYKDSIRAQFLRYSDLLARKEYAKSADYLNPGMFKLVPKAEMIKVMKESFNSPDVDMSFEEPEVISISDSKLINGQNYAKLKYSCYMSLRLKDQSEGKEDTASIKQALQAEYGQNKVTYNASTGAYRIFAIEEVGANSINKRKWTFIVIKEERKALLKKFIPKELL